jgi:ABC-type sugar transport system permease subunit
MAWTKLSEFDFDPRANVFLYLERGRPLTSAIVTVGLVALLLLVAALVVDPDWQPRSLRGKGAWIIALLLLLPIAVRVVVLGVVTGITAEAAFRGIWQAFDGKPDYLIGTSGIADLSPWRPCFILWRDLHELRRLTTSQWSGPEKPILLQFAARRQPPSWVPLWFWSVLPAWLTERSVTLAPEWVGLDFRGFEWLIERYAGRIAIRDCRWG